MAEREQPERTGGGELTLVVVAYHREAALARLLDSAVGQAARIVVVNVENDTVVAKVAAERGADVVALASNPGYAAAVNAGTAGVDTPLVAFANDDLELAPGCLAALVTELSGGADVAVPRLYRPDGRIEASVARLVTPAALAGEWVLLPDDPPAFLPGWFLGRLPVQKWRRPERCEPVEAAEAALVATRTELLVRFPLPEGYFLYWEEHEWFHRLRREGRKVAYVPAAGATHAGWDGLSPEKAALLATNAIRCLADTGGGSAAVLGWPVVVAWWLRLWLVDALQVALRPSDAGRERLRTRTAGLKAALGAWRQIVPRAAGPETGTATVPDMESEVKPNLDPRPVAGQPKAKLTLFEQIVKKTAKILRQSR
jgi:N-acetylglucosaminyl-diphospho-decaprenol L-rhamnosyltransferase